MKKLIALALIMAMVLVGCDKQEKGNTGDVNINDINNNNNAVDYSYTSDVVKKRTITEYTTEGKETKLIPDTNARGELNIACLPKINNGGLDYYDAAIAIFKKLYPNVQVNVETPESNAGDYIAYAAKLEQDILNDNGPDVFWLEYFDDPFKLMASGKLADLAPYIEKDKGFNINDFNSSVFYGGQLNGKQHIIPIDYMIPLMITTKNVADEVGFDPAKCNDYIGFAEEIAKIIRENKQGYSKENIVYDLYTPFVAPLFTGIDWIDYENNTVDLNSPALKRIYELIKDSYLGANMYGVDYAGTITSGVDRATCFSNKENTLVDFSDHSLYEFVKASRTLYEYGEAPLVLPWRNVNGKIDATILSSVSVSENSQNKENAYRFIKILISPEFYARYFINNEAYTNIPINNNLVKKVVEQSPDKEGDFEVSKKAITSLDGLPQEDIDNYMGYLSDVENVQFRTYGLDILREAMKPYLKGEKTYEECIQDAQSKLEAYIAE